MVIFARCHRDKMKINAFIWFGVVQCLTVDADFFRLNSGRLRVAEQIPRTRLNNVLIVIIIAILTKLLTYTSPKLGWIVSVMPWNVGP